MLSKIFSKDDSDKDNLIRELQNKISALENKVEQFVGIEKSIRELQDKIAKLEKNDADIKDYLDYFYSTVEEDFQKQKLDIEKLVHQVQEIAKLESKNSSPISEENLPTKIVAAKSSDQKLFVIQNGVERKMNWEEIFDLKFTDLKAVSYNIAPDFVIEVAKNKSVTIIFDNGCLQLFIKDCKKKFYTSDDFKNIEIRVGKIGTKIHDKIFLLTNKEQKNYRVITGSANFTNSAFRENNFESIRVDDSKELYDLYLQRFNFLLLQTYDSIPELKKLNKNYQLSEYFSSGQFAKELGEKNKFIERKSGFKNLDKKQIIYPGLYVLGGAPGVGKTTFVWQLLNQFAMNGETCIFCSYETSELDLNIKSMAQENFSTWKEKAFLTSEYIKKILTIKM